MFGYVRPLKAELKVREYEDFRAVYCGLCHTLRSRYGVGSRMMLSYDMCFLALFMSDAIGRGGETCRRRCVVSPLRRRTCVSGDPALSFAADCSVILTWWKIRDSVRDERGIKRLAARIGALFMRRKYRRAAAAQPGFSRAAEEGICRLTALEKANTPSIDRPADGFANILKEAAAGIPDERVRRPAEVVLYHVGRWVYILDAWDDLEEDGKSGSYNAVAARFEADTPEGLSEAKDAVRLTLLQSAQTAAAACELMEPGRYGPIIRNTLYLGLPAMAEAVFRGETKQRSARHGSI